MAIHHFGHCRFDSTTGRLERNGHPVALRPRVVALLSDLITRRARRVTRSELASRLWSGGVVTESSFSTLVAELRKAVGDDGRRQRVIRTFGSAGYRFVAAVRVESGDLAGGRAAGAESVHEHRGLEAFDVVADAPTMALAGASLERALTDGPRHMQVLGDGCDRFVHDWACTARDRGFAVHRAQCVSEDAPPLWPWWQIAASLLDARETAAQSALSQDGRSSAAGRRCSSPAQDDPHATWRRIWTEIDVCSKGHDGGSPMAKRQRRFALGHDIARALVRTARAAPCAIVLERFSIADFQSDCVLQRVMTDMTRAPVWIVTSREAGPSSATARGHHAAPLDPPARPRTDIVGLTTHRLRLRTTGEDAQRGPWAAAHQGADFESDPEPATDCPIFDAVDRVS